MQSVDDFKDYMSNMGKTLRHVAAEAAMGWVHKRSDLGAVSGLYGSNLSLDKSDWDLSRRRTGLDDNVSLQEEDFGGGGSGPPSRTKFDILLQSPVIMLPRKPNSPEVLVGHLGTISIRNSAMDEEAEGFPIVSTPASMEFCENSLSQRTEKIHMKIRDMNVYSMNLEKQKAMDDIKSSSRREDSSLQHTLSASHLHGDLLPRNNYGTPVLHDTVIELTIQKIEPNPPFINPPDTTLDLDFGSEDFAFKSSGAGNEGQNQDEEASVLKIQGKVVTPLKLVLSKFVYEQMLQTLDNITPPDEDEQLVQLPGPTSPREKMSQSSLSALRFVIQLTFDRTC